MTLRQFFFVNHSEISQIIPIRSCRSCVCVCLSNISSMYFILDYGTD